MALVSNRVKYLYSYGGKILPRPSDGKLRYVGGETRIMALHRNITFADLTAKMAEAVGFDVLLKCQLPGEEPDALVSIKSDEELESILEEYDSLPTKFRVFLFLKPSNSFRPVTLRGLSIPPLAVNPRVAEASSGDMKGERATICPKPRILQGLEMNSCSVPRIRFVRKATKESTLALTAYGRIFTKESS